MPVPELMTWVPSQRRWTKMHRGQRYYISARQLGTVETKEASLHAANEWWRTKHAELNLAHQAAKRVPLPGEDIANASLALQGVTALDLARHYDKQLIGALLDLLQERTQGRFTSESKMAVKALYDHPAYEPESEIIAPIVQAAVGDFLSSIIVTNSALPETFTEQLPPARAAQVERAVKELRGDSAADPQRTIQALANSWLTGKQEDVHIAKLSAPRLSALRVHIKHAVGLLGEGRDAATVNEESVEAVFNYCRSKIAQRLENPEKGWSTPYAKEVFTVTRCFVRWLVEKNILKDSPRNLESRRFTFGSMEKEIETWTVDEVNKLFGEATGVLRLAMLLQLNCGMSQKDVSDLLDTEVDWQRGRITRKRSKTRRQKSTPTVCYQLWPGTFAVLKAHRSGQPRVLLTKSGKPFVNKRLVDGRFRAVDSLGDLFRRLQKKLGFSKAMKLLRKTSASILETHEIYGRFSSLFLGHAPSEMKDKHYTAVPQELFDKAVNWLGQQLGFVDAD